MRKTSKISRFLPGSLLKKMRSRQTDAEKLGHIWPAIVGQDLAEHSTPASYKYDVLTVFADNANWASKLRHSLPAIMQQCRKQKNLKALSKIKIKIGLMSGVAKKDMNTAPKLSRISKTSATLILESAKHIEDETLRASLERLGGSISDKKSKNE